MIEQKTIDEARRDAEDCPIAWFALLERARNAGQYELAAQAQRELERLGVKVSYRGKRRNRGKGAANA